LCYEFGIRFGWDSWLAQPDETLDHMTANDDDMLGTLEKRLGRLHARQRLGIEKDHEAQVFGQGLNFFHLENATLSHSLIRGALMLTGLYWRGLSNTAKVELKHNRIVA
jgi:uncharacterized protein